MGLSGPYLIKLDVQGAQEQVLKGARDVLTHTHAVICEADMDDFHALDRVLVDAGFGLFDLTHPNWLADRTLGWFYPIYLHRSLDHLKSRAFWEQAQNRQVIKMQDDRRGRILKQLREMLAEERARPGR